MKKLTKTSIEEKAEKLADLDAQRQTGRVEELQAMKRNWSDPNHLKINLPKPKNDEQGKCPRNEGLSLKHADDPNYSNGLVVTFEKVDTKCFAILQNEA